MNNDDFNKMVKSHDEYVDEVKVILRNHGWYSASMGYETTEILRHTKNTRINDMEKLQNHLQTSYSPIAEYIRFQPDLFAINKKKKEYLFEVKIALNENQKTKNISIEVVKYIHLLDLEEKIDNIYLIFNNFKICKPSDIKSNVKDNEIYIPDRWDEEETKKYKDYFTKRLGSRFFSCNYSIDRKVGSGTPFFLIKKNILEKMKPLEVLFSHDEKLSNIQKQRRKNNVLF